MSDKAQGGAAAQMGLCPVCKQGPVTVQASHDDGRQQGYCKQHDSFLPLVRDSASEPWRLEDAQP
jgi:hypothetical protein